MTSGRQRGSPPTIRPRRPNETARPRYSRAHPPRRRVDPATFELDESLDRQDTTQNIAEWVVLICIAILAAFFVKAFLFQAFWIPSASMEPTLVEGDRIIVNRITYDFGSIERGDVIVFERPEGEIDPTVEHLVKRVIGLPGDRLEARGGALYRNGNLASEPYLPPGTITDNLPPTVVPDGQLWVMGDNRGNSSDSRVFGPIDGDLVVGKAIFRFWPVSKIGRI